MATGDLLTFLLALYAALISTVLGIREIRRDRRKVLVTCKIAFIPSLPPPAGQFVSIEVVNVGHRPVQIVSAGLLMSDGNMFMQIKSGVFPLSLPKKLEDGDNVTIYLDYDQIEEAIRERKEAGVLLTKAVVRDAEGKTYTSRLPKILKQNGLAR